MNLPLAGRRNPSRSNPLLSNESWLRQKYPVDNLNMQQISRLVGMTGKAVKYWLKEFKIQIKPRNGKDHPLWNPSLIRCCLKCGTSIPTRGRRASGLCFKCSNISRRGENNPGYVPPHLRMTDERTVARKTYYKDWRFEVFQRDGYKCQVCKRNTHDLAPHHILNFWSHKDLRYEPSNGITLCRRCHLLFHKLCGRKFNNGCQLFEFFSMAEWFLSPQNALS